MIDPRPLALVLLAALPSPARQESPPETLSASSAIARVTDREGTATRRGLGARPAAVEAGAELAPGEVLEVATRGANALALRLAGGARLVLGPGAAVELAAADLVRVLRGELLLDTTDARRVTLAGPGDTSLEVGGRQAVRARDDALVVLSKDPAWLVGYESDASTEALGSLLANVDGRNVPLTIGYHKVTVDVRDQIARTVVEESFVNHTHSVLEGVFYFPLPADASISSFGMWIGDELVQGDIVEKERAREIYETILREKRDPGLLEWTGGNVFKARVYPIGAEKRIRIAYTQVLPKTGDGYAYRYALQSELLRRTPLRRLEITVDVSSDRPLASVECTSHATRTRATEHAARVEYTAEEIAPDRDFEVVVTERPTDEPLALVPHRRGDDGYFMLLVDAPAVEPAPADAEASALDLLLLLDTSASVSPADRATQVAFVEALLSALGERDTFDLATVDVETRFAFGHPEAPGRTSRERALGFLEARDPLGWTDLVAAVDLAARRAGPSTHVVYVGDGVSTAGPVELSQPAEVAHELERRYRGRGTFHAVVPGARSEMPVLRSLAGLGGGSVRTIGGGAGDAVGTAFALLAELTAPAVKDLAVAFEGLDVAAVHPARIPNLPAGGQQVVVGRFDPRSPRASGRVVVTGTLDGEPVRFERAVTLETSDDPADGAFVPRLWARRHLDTLLDQGSSKEVRERVVALSEDFQIVTPYTSFLVLESDADRERFGVLKRFRMRDGEEFFAEGRAAAEHELAREQMRAARAWRRGWRERLVASWADLGRGLSEALRGGRPGWAGAVGGLELARLGYAGDESDAFEARRESEEVFEDDASNEPADLEEGELAQNEDFDAPAESVVEEKVADRAYRQRGMRADYAAKRAAASAPALAMEAGRLGSFGLPVVHAPAGAFDALFPHPGPPRGDAPQPRWSPEVAALLARLDRRAALAASTGGWRIATERTLTDHHGRTRVHRGTWLVGPERWVSLAPHVEGEPFAVEWADAAERGVLLEGWRLGRLRAAEDGDRAAWPTPFAWHFGDQVQQFARYDAELGEDAEGRPQLELFVPADPDTRLVLAIDAERGLVVEETWVVRGEATRGTSFGQPVEVGGQWWPGVVREWSARGGTDVVTRVEVAALAPEEVARRADAELARRADAILPRERSGADDPPRARAELAAAKQAVREERAGLDERLLLLDHLVATARFDEAAAHLAALEALVGERRGFPALRITWLESARRREELASALARVAADLAGTPREGEHGPALFVLAHTRGLRAAAAALEILDRLAPLLERSAIPDAAVPFEEARLRALAGLQRPEAYFEAVRAHAERWRHVTVAQTRMAQALAARGEVDAAVAWLDAALRGPVAWNDHERTLLLGETARILSDGYRLDELVERFERLEEDAPALLNAAHCDLYLTSLVYLDREERSRERVAQWLALAGAASDDPADSWTAARLHAAVQQALGQGRGLYRRRFDDRYARLLADTARVLLAAERDTHLTGWILSHWGWRATDAGRELLGELALSVGRDFAELDAARLAARLGWLANAELPLELDAPSHEALLERAFARFAAGSDPEPGRTALAGALVVHGSPDLRARTRRVQLDDARATEDAEAVRVAAAALFAELLGHPWTQATEEELSGLVPLLEPEDAEPGDSRLDAAVLALHDLAGWVIEARTAAAVRAVPDYESLTRRELGRERARARSAGRLAAAERMAELAERLATPVLADWAELERTTWLVREGRDLEAAWERALALLEARVALLAGDDVPARERVLAERAATIAAWLLVHDDNTADARRAVLFDLLARLPDSLETGGAPPDGRAWRRDLLVVLDRPAELAELLDRWFDGGGDVALARFGRDRARLAAELGDLERAVALFEQVDRLDELSEEDLRALADLYTALDRRGAAEDALARSLAVLGEDALAQDLQRRLGLYQRHGDDVPPELDPEVPLRFRVLMEKTRAPGDRVWMLEQYWRATKDFRLLECLAPAILGHASEEVYTFLARAAGLAGSIDEEAVVDRLEARLTALADGAPTPTDRRALALLRFRVAGLAAAQSHGTERHVERAVAALRLALRADPEAWSEGELGRMAELLAGCGRLSPEALATALLEALRALARLATEPDERLATSAHLARSLVAHGRRDEAVRVLEAALDARREAAGGRLPVHAHGALEELCAWHVQGGAFRRAEELWRAELAGGYPPAVELALRERLFGLYRDAVLARAELSLGRGDALYRTALSELRSELARRTNEQHARNVVSILADLWTRGARERVVASVGRDATAFAFGDLPRVLALYQYRGGQAMVGNLAECLARVRGAGTALEFLVVRAENEPSWLALPGQDFWAQHAWRLGNLLVEARPAVGGDLDRRALAIVLAELEDDLASRRSRNLSVYHERYHTYRGEWRPEYLRTALDFVAERDRRPDATPSLEYAADYLYRGISAHGEAIDVLAELRRSGRISHAGRDTLATFLQEQQRFRESLPVLGELVAEAPLEARFRVMQMRAHAKLGDRAALVRAFTAGEAALREGGAWEEGAIALLAGGALETELLEDAVRLFDDAIALHVRTAPRRGVGDGVVSGYYRRQSQALVKLGQTDRAVDAAAGAVVSWGRHVDERGRELENLVAVLAAAEDLVAYVERLDAEVAESGLENPIVRRALGEAFLRRGDRARAARELSRAHEARPNDETTTALLARVLDELGRGDQAVAVLLEQARSAEHDYGLWTEVGRRFAALEDATRAERAFTTLVEVSPNESEGHQALAGVREEQRDFDAAAAHWRHVARVRSKEPTGFLGLARALVRADRRDEAREVVEHLRSTSWPERFGDVRAAAEALLRDV